MTHDFAKSRPADEPRPRVNLTLWLITLIVVTAFSLFLNYLWKIKPEAKEFTENLKQEETIPPKLTDHLAGAEAIKDIISDDDKRFNFYKLLPEFNVEQNIKDAVTTTQKQNGGHSPYERKTTPGQPEILGYYIQTDSFRNHDEANQRRGELILMGFDAAVTKVDLDTKGIWYRVSVGPFDTKRSTNKALNTLARNNIDGSIRTITN